MKQSGYPKAWWAAMMVCALFALASITQESAADEWTGKDKAGHAKAGAAIGVVTTAATSSAGWGCAAATAAGIGKEVWDKYHPGHEASVKDATVTAVAGCLASKIAGLIVGPNFIGKEWRF
jgi:uncharacterized protein YfiM (DUF2279 family)